MQGMMQNFAISIGWVSRLRGVSKQPFKMVFQVCSSGKEAICQESSPYQNDINMMQKCTHTHTIHYDLVLAAVDAFLVNLVLQIWKTIR